ncbi:MAG TPA: site-2 protease family protein [Myxococcaceae bacterium]|nr:site-2 protease family protein [Myxococcaceae bacterium]
MQPETSPSVPSRQSRTTWSAAGAVALGVLAKGKVLLGGLKALSLGKVLLSAGSMLGMIWVYAVAAGWRFAVGFVLLIFVHEMGHAVAIREAGLPAGYPVFIPFFGAVIALKGQPRSSLVEARIAIAGPVAGGAAALVCAAGYLLTHERWWLALASAGFILNLFNLTPLPPLDGGRVARMFNRKAWIVGLVLIALMLVAAPSPPLILIAVLGAMQAFRGGEPSPGPDEDRVTPADRRWMAVKYFALCGSLAAAAWCCSVLLLR